MAAKKRHTKSAIRGPADEEAARQGCWFDPEAADHAVAFYANFLRHTTGGFAGRPFILQPWQAEDVIRPLFGWMTLKGVRRFSCGYIEIPKKNGKSTLVSGIGLYMLTADQEPKAQCYSAASDREQAGIIFREAASMVRASPALQACCEVVQSRKTLFHPESGSFLRALAAEVGTADGIDAHLVLFDELHQQKTRDLWDILRYAGSARRQPLVLSITTAGYDRHSICFEQHTYAEQVRDGVIKDPAFFSYIRAASPEDDWTDPKTWAKANPSLGVTISMEGMAQACLEAQNSPAKENNFKRLRLNIWTEQDMRWIRMERWDKCEGEITPEELVGKPCWVGLDLASTTDIAAAVAVFKLGEERYALLPKFWAPKDTARERGKRDRVPYEDWAKKGLITLTDGDVTDYDVLRRELVAWLDGWNVKEIVIDRWNSSHLAQQLQNEDGLEVIGFGQGFASMNAPTKYLEALILAGNLRHDGHETLRWMVSNVAVETDAAGNLKPSKRKSTEKIDGVVASIMGLGRAMVADNGRSPYEERGFAWV